MPSSRATRRGEPLVLQLFLFVLGLAGLYYGAEWLVKGAARLALELGVRPLVVGLTVVAFGTSAPELVVGVIASVERESAVVLGNVIGSNVLNIALILGVAALIRPLSVGMRLLSRDVPIMVGASFMVLMMALDGGLGRVDGLLLFVGFVGYLGFVVSAARAESPDVQAEFEHFEEEAGALQAVPSGRARDVALVTLGLLLLAVGAHLLVVSAVFFARLLAVPELVIGLTVVALGTSLPELATCAVAAVRGESDIALGNAVGSNLFNLLPILGVSALIRPIPVEASVVAFELPVMIGVAMALVPLAWYGRRLGRASGALLFAGYVAFTVVLVVRL